MKTCATQEVFDKLSPAFGEHVFHHFTVDDRIPSQSLDRFEEIKSLCSKYDVQNPRRILELSANDRFTIHLLSEHYRCDAYAIDICGSALERGLEFSRNRGIDHRVRALATDFHALPFSDGYFDLVYVYQSLHHTRTPEVVVGEAMRVLQADGILAVFEEPVIRALCLNTMVTNRISQWTAVEKQLGASGTLPYLCNPNGQARPEFLFGIIENQQISLAQYFAPVTDNGEVLSVNTGDPFRYATERDKLFVKWVARYGRDAEDVIFESLECDFSLSKELQTVSEKRMGFRLPEAEEIRTLACMIVERLQGLEKVTGPQQQRDLFALETFGGTIDYVARKTMSQKSQPQKIDAEAGYLLNKVTRLPFRVNGRDISFNTLLPDLQEQEYGDNCYGPDFKIIMDPGNIRSAVNVGNPASMTLDLDPHGLAALFVRYYAIEQAGGYFCRFSIDGKVIANEWIGISESRLVRYLFEGRVHNLTIELVDEHGVLLRLPMPEVIRIGYLNCFNIVGHKMPESFSIEPAGMSEACPEA